MHPLHACPIPGLECDGELAEKYIETTRILVAGSDHWHARLRRNLCRFRQIKFLRTHVPCRRKVLAP